MNSSLFAHYDEESNCECPLHRVQWAYIAEFMIHSHTHGFTFD